MGRPKGKKNKRWTKEENLMSWQELRYSLRYSNKINILLTNYV